MNIRITATPPGEAPEEVPAAWVGLTLPADDIGLKQWLSIGVITGKQPRSSLQLFIGVLFRRIKVEWIEGYRVNPQQAVEILAEHAPEAAKWWRENGSHMLQPDKRFIFHKEVSQEVKGEWTESFVGAHPPPTK